MHIGSTRFLDNDASDVMLSSDRKIQEEPSSFIVKEIYTMLIFYSCISYNKSNCQELEAIYIINNKNKLIKKVDLDDQKTAAK